MVVWKLFPGGSFRFGGTGGGWLKVKRWSDRRVSLFDSEIYERFFETPSEDELIMGLRIFKGETLIHEIDWTTKVDQDSWATHVWVTITDDMRIEYSVDMPETRVYGYFNDVNTLVPIQGVQVTIGPYFVYSDNNGFYSLSGLFGTEFDVKAEHPNYQTLYVHPVNVENFVYRWDRLMTPSTGPPIEPGITISGQVLTKEDNVPILDALVRWGAAQTTTDSSGQYTLTDVVPGAEWLTAYAADKKTQSKPLSTPMTGTVTQDFELEKDVPVVVPEESKFPYAPTGSWSAVASNLWNIIQLSFPTSMAISAPYIADSIYRFITATDPITGESITPGPREFNEFQLYMAVEMGLFGAVGAAAKGAIGALRGVGHPMMGGASDFVYHNFNTGGMTAVSGFVGRFVSAVRGISGRGLGLGFIYLPFLSWNVIEALFYIPLMTTNLEQTSWNVINSNIIGISKQFDRLNRYIYRVEGGQALSESEEDICNKIFESLELLIHELEDTVEMNKAPLESTGFYNAAAVMVPVLREQLDTTKELLGLTEFWIDLPESFTINSPTTLDGDTIGYYNEKKVRLVGIDTHEIGTRAGVVERDYLKSLIQAKVVTVYVDEYKKADRYGRILGVLFLDGENICHKMLARFGEYILPKSTYWKRHKYVDWDENKIIAQSREIPIAEPIAEPYAEEVGELHITSSPTYAKIFLDGSDTGLRTAETIKNIPVGNYTITLQAVGYDTATTTASVEVGRTTEVDLDLIKQPVPAKERKPSRTTLETHFKDAIISEDDSRSGLADLGYTPEEVDNFLSEWILELKQHQIMEIYLGNVATKERVKFYLQYQGYTDADIDGLFIRWDEEAERRVEQATLGNIAVTSEPKYADVYIDGDQWAGVTPMLIRGVSPGTHTVKCTYYEYQDKEQEVTVLAGKEVTVHLVLVKTTP